MGATSGPIPWAGFDTPVMFVMVIVGDAGCRVLPRRRDPINRPGGPMPSDDDTLEEQTLSFQQPESIRPESGADDPVHLLLLLDDNAPPKRYPLRTLPVVIGRNPPADLILEGPTVSRRHCRLELRDGRLSLTDLASTNGTFVNGVRLTEAAALEDGATIGVGAYRLRYHRRNQDETADADAMEQEWRDAGKYVASILPRPIDQGPVRANWFYLPIPGSAAMRSATRCWTSGISRCSCWMSPGTAPAPRCTR